MVRNAWKCIAVLSLVLTSARTASADTIKLTDGKTHEGVSVMEEGYDTVKYRLPNVSQAQTIKAEKVSFIEYGKTPVDYKQALGSMEERDYETARSLFLGATQSNARSYAWVKQYGFFYAAECTRFQNKWDDAIKAYDNLLREVPNTRFYPDALLAKAQCLLNSGKQADAKKAIEGLISEASSKGFGDRWGHEANLFLAQMNEDSDPSGALSQYQNLYQSTRSDYPDVANKARLRIGYVFIRQGKVDDAQKYFQEIIDNRLASPDPIVAGAYNGLGVSLYNNKGAGPAQLKEALYHFLRVIYHYEVREEQAQALYWGGKIFSQLGGANDGPRAKLLFSRCQQEFPGTQWADRASKEAQ